MSVFVFKYSINRKNKNFSSGGCKNASQCFVLCKGIFDKKNKNFHQAAPLPGIKGDRDLDRPWGQISQNQSENDKKEKIVQRSQLCDHLVGRRDTMNAESNETLPVSEKYMLTIKEAAAYFNIGIKKLRRIAEDNLGTVAVYCGNRFLIIRPKFEEFILNSSEI